MIPARDILVKQVATVAQGCGDAKASESKEMPGCEMMGLKVIKTPLDRAADIIHHNMYPNTLAAPPIQFRKIVSCFFSHLG